MRILKSWLFASLIFASQGLYAAVADDPAKVTPVDLGAKAPAFLAKELTSQDFNFDPEHLAHPALLIFYRGGWCPYCNRHLHELKTVVPKIHALGYQVLFLSSDRPELLYSSLKEKVDYHLLSDSAMAAARAFGVAYRVDDATLLEMKKFGIDLEATQGTTAHELPVPAVFIVDRSGIVRFRHFNPDYRLRLDSASLLKAAKLAH